MPLINAHVAADVTKGLNLHLHPYFVYPSMRVSNFVANYICIKSIRYSVSGRGLLLWLFVGPTGVYLLDFFCSGIQFYLLLSPYLCFISLLYLDLYVLGDDALIS